MSAPAILAIFHSRFFVFFCFFFKIILRRLTLKANTFMLNFNSLRKQLNFTAFAERNMTISWTWGLVSHWGCYATHKLSPSPELKEHGRKLWHWTHQLTDGLSMDTDLKEPRISRRLLFRSALIKKKAYTYKHYILNYILIIHSSKNETKYTRKKSKQKQCKIM